MDDQAQSSDSSPATHDMAFRFCCKQFSRSHERLQLCFVCRKYVWPLQEAQNCLNCRLCVHQSCDDGALEIIAPSCTTSTASICALGATEEDSKAGKRSLKKKLPKTDEAVVEMAERMLDEPGGVLHVRTLLAAAVEKFPGSVLLRSRQVQLLFDCGLESDAKIMLSELQYRAPMASETFVLLALVQPDVCMGLQKMMAALKHALEIDSANTLAARALEELKLNLDLSKAFANVSALWKRGKSASRAEVKNGGVRWWEVEEALANCGFRVPQAASVLFCLPAPKRKSKVREWRRLRDWHTCFADPNMAFAYLLELSCRREFVGFTTDSSLVDQALSSMPDGAWLLRGSSQPGSLTLTIKRTSSLANHKRIQLSEIAGGSFRLTVEGAAGLQFEGPDALDKLLDHFRRQSPFGETGVLLSEPYRRPETCFKPEVEFCAGALNLPDRPVR